MVSVANWDASYVLIGSWFSEGPILCRFLRSFGDKSPSPSSTCDKISSHASPGQDHLNLCRHLPPSLSHAATSIVGVTSRRATRTPPHHRHRSRHDLRHRPQKIPPLL